VPRDSTQVDTTWRFVNKNGGPDRRFNNNSQIPILQYGEVVMRTDVRPWVHPDFRRRQTKFLVHKGSSSNPALITPGFYLSFQTRSRSKSLVQLVSVFVSMLNSGLTAQQW
jgi:hypothetical protein